MRVRPTAGSWVFDRNRFSSVTCPTPLAPAPKSTVFCTFGQTMVQKHGPTLSRKSDLKDLQVLCGQTMVQNGPNDASSHKLRLSFCFLEGPQTRRVPLSGKAERPPCRQRAGVVPSSPCPREEGRQKRRVDPRKSNAEPRQSMRRPGLGVVCRLACHRPAWSGKGELLAGGPRNAVPFLCSFGEL